MINPGFMIDPGLILWIFIFIICFIMPTALTIWNIVNLFVKKAFLPSISALLTVFIGLLDYVLLFAIMFDPVGEWYEAGYTGQFHNLISGQYEISIVIPMLIGLLGLFALLIFKPEKLSPVISALSIAGTIILNVVQIMIAIQISEQILNGIEGAAISIDYLYYVYHFNILVISAIAIKKQIGYQLNFYKKLPSTSVKSKLTIFLYSKINNIYKYSGFVFLCLLFVVALMEIVFILIGQGADGPIKAFTDTADWTFSRQTPPPPIEYEGHYLCTVAAGGHKKVVKPLRFGIRRGQRIVVNRQLCVANAFEDYIQTKFPEFHRFIRGIYDKYGYPISKHITTRTRADIIYFLMKPLEWIFLGFLYTMDVNPEDRIRKQYREH